MDPNILAIWEYDNPSDLALAKAQCLASNQDSTLSVAAFSFSDSKPLGETELRARITAAVGNNIKVVEATGISSQSINSWLLGNNHVCDYQLVVKSASKQLLAVKDEADWELIRNLKYPLLLSMNRPWQTNKLKVLATLDIADESLVQKQINHGVLSVAQAAQATLNAELHVVYVIAIAKALSELAIKESDQVLHEKGDIAHVELDGMLAAADIKHAKTYVLAGYPPEEIANLANKQKYDLVIMGSVGRTGLKGLLLGNTAEKTIENLREDLLVIKPIY